MRGSGRVVVVMVSREIRRESRLLWGDSKISAAKITFYGMALNRVTNRAAGYLPNFPLRAVPDLAPGWPSGILQVPPQFL